MAFWVVGRGSSFEATGPATYLDGEGSFKRDYQKFQFAGGEETEYHNDYNETFRKRLRYDSWSDSHHRDGPPKDSIHVKNLAFLVIRETSPTLVTESEEVAKKPHLQHINGSNSDLHNVSSSAPTTNMPRPTGFMERTESGLSISSDAADAHDVSDILHTSDQMLSDTEAAKLVRTHVATYRRRFPDSRNQRILKTLINPRSREADFPLDNDALRSIFSAANELFFANRLSQRVAWDWSSAASARQYENHIVGTTALRKSARLGGYETLIVLSSPILKDTQYNRRLLISTFLHEMIHSFLFVTTGMRGVQEAPGGHTVGFRQIAAIIDQWAGRDYLRLENMDADLDHFRTDAAHTCSHQPIPTDYAVVPSVSHTPACRLSDLSRAVSSEWLGTSFDTTALMSHDKRAVHCDEGYDQNFSYATNMRLPPFEYADRDGWHWHDREGFLARQAGACP